MEGGEEKDVSCRAHLINCRRGERRIGKMTERGKGKGGRKKQRSLFLKSLPMQYRGGGKKGGRRVPR